MGEEVIVFSIYVDNQYFCKSANSRAIFRLSFSEFLCLTDGCTGQCSQAIEPADPKRKNLRSCRQMASVNCLRETLTRIRFFLNSSQHLTFDFPPLEKKFIFHEADKTALF